MALMDTIIITPWVAAADDPDPESPSNHPRLTDDYGHSVQVTVESRGKRGNMTAAINSAKSMGPLFREKLNYKAKLHDFGMGVRAPQDEWVEIKLQAALEKRPVDPWLMGPAEDPGEDQFEMFRLEIDAVTEGIRLWEDKTGQQTPQLIPNPNQYSVRATMEEAVLQLIEDDPTYWYLTGFTVQPDDPEDPPIPESPLSLPPADQMTQERRDAYEAWQQGYGIPAQFTGEMINAYPQDNGAPPSDLPTNGEATVVTVEWQSGLDTGAPALVIPSANRLRGRGKKLGQFHRGNRPPGPPGPPQ